MALNILTFGVRGVDADILKNGNQQLNGNVGPNELTAANLISSSGLPFQQLLLYVGEANDGDLNIDAGETAYNLSDMASNDRVISLAAANANDALRITAHGLNSNTALGDLTAYIRYDNTLGFGLGNATDGSQAAHYLNAGDSLTFELTQIGGTSQFLASASFTVNVNGGGSENVVIDYDGETVGDGIDLGSVANGTTVTLDFIARTIRVGAATRAMTDSEYLIFLAGGLNKLTIGSSSSSMQGFAIGDLAIASTDVAVSGEVIIAPPAGGLTAGTAEDDIIIGSTASDTINAGAGNDVIFGGGSADAIDGGDGDDIIDGGDGSDILNGGVGNDMIMGGLGDDTMTGGAGADRFVIRSLAEIPANTDYIQDLEIGVDLVDLAQINGLIFVGSAAFSGTPGQVRFQVGAGQTEIQVDANGDLTVDHRIIITNGQFNLTETVSGSLVLEAKPIMGTIGDDALNGLNQYDELLIGLTGHDLLVGGARNDILNGGAGNDLVHGGSGDDILIYRNGDGADVLDGGGDNDVMRIVGASYVADTIFVSYNGSALTAINGGTLTGLEAVELDLTAGPESSADLLTSYGRLLYITSANVVVDLGAGVASGFASVAGVNQLTTGSGNDTLTGGSGVDRIFAGGGSDTIHGGDGNDAILAGGNGNDFIYGDSGDDVIRGNSGDDYLDGGLGNDRASYADATTAVVVDLNIQGVAQNTGGGGVDTLVNMEWASGSQFADVLIGTTGANLFFGNSGDDLIIGGGGTDQFFFNTFPVDFGDVGTVVVDANVADGEKLSFDLNLGLPAGLHLADGSTLDDGDPIKAGTLLGGGVASVVIQNGLVFDWDGDGVADLTVKFTTSSVSLVYQASDKSFVLQTSGVFDNTGQGVGAPIAGTVGNDTLNGSASNDYILSVLGNDTINANAGDDYADGGDGNDVLNGGDNNDTLVGGAGADQLFGNNGNDVLVVGANTNLAEAGEIYNGGAGIDTIQIDTGVLSPGQFYQTGFYGAGTQVASIERILFNDTAPGANMALFLSFQLGGGIANNATFVGSENHDEVVFLAVLGGVHTLAGTSFTLQDWTTVPGEFWLGDAMQLNAAMPGFSYTLIGSSGNDVIQGNNLADVLQGGDGNDTLVGRGGTDSFSGGNGNDVILIGSNDPAYADNYALMTFDGGADTDLLLTFGQVVDLTGSGIVLTGFEGIGLSHTLTFYAAGPPPVALPPLLGSQIVVDQSILSQLPSALQIRGSGHYLTSTGELLTQEDIVNIIMSPGDVIDMSTWTFTLWEDWVDYIAVSGSTANDLITGSIMADDLFGAEGDDTIHGGGGDDGIGGWEGADTIYAGDGNDLIQGGNGIDTIYGGDGDDLINMQQRANANNGIGEFAYGEGGDDVIRNTSGDDLIDGGTGTDRVTYFFQNAGVIVDLNIQGLGNAQNTVGGGLDTLISIENLSGSSFNDTLSGNSGANFIIGGSGSDFIYGHDGDDRFLGDINDAATGTLENGDDYIDGGAGIDTLNYEENLGRTEGVFVDLAAGVGGSISGGESDTLISVENIDGTQHDDEIFGNGVANVLTGLAGTDFLQGRAGVDALDGGDGDDTLHGGDDSDTLIGGAGNDILIGQQGAVQSSVSEYIYGGAGNDFLRGGNADDVLDGGDGVDRTSYFNVNGAVTIDLNIQIAQNTSGAGLDTLVSIENVSGSTFDDTLIGNGDANLLHGGYGNDIIQASAGDDTLVGDGDVVLGDDTFDGGSGIDTVSYSSGYFETRTAGVSVNLATGTGGAIGGGETDTYANIENVEGTSNGDVITGDAHNNTLTGFGGADVLTGGAGEDTFMFHAGQSNGDIVIDFDGAGDGAGDMLVFEGYGTQQDGASIVQLDATRWQITSADGLTIDILTLANGASVHVTDFVFGGP